MPFGKVQNASIITSTRGALSPSPDRLSASSSRQTRVLRWLSPALRVLSPARAWLGLAVSSEDTLRVISHDYVLLFLFVFKHFSLITTCYPK